MKGNYRKTEVPFSFLIHSLYGDKDYRLIHTSHNFADAKRYYLQIVKSIKFAIEENIQIIDNYHKQELLNTINEYEDSIKSSRNFDKLDQEMVSFQSEIIFRLLGGMPRRWRRKKVINRRSEWKLDSYRQIQYTQNVLQKEMLIFSAVQGKYKEIFGSWEEFQSNVYYLECRGDPNELISWLRENHPDIYSDLF